MENIRKRTVKIQFILAVVMLLLSLFPVASSADSSADATFTFSDTGITVSGSNSSYKISGTTLTISGAGTYVITGSCSEGSIEVKKGTTGVTLVLEDLTLSASETGPVILKKSTEVTLDIEGTVNLTDNEDPANEESTDTEVADAFEGAVIKVKDGGSLTITGSGTLNIDAASCKNGIKGGASSSVTVESGSINVEAANNGLASDGSVVINGGALDITAGNDGIKAEPDEDDTDSAGTITVTGGSITIESVGDGIQCTNDLTISGGTIDVTANDGYTTALSDDSDSCKGIKSDTAINITGGELILNCADDAIHCNGNIAIRGGTLVIDSGDDGIKADYELIIGIRGSSSGPDITIDHSYEGIEGAVVTFNSGTGNITASDDGVNAANSDLADYVFLLTVNGGSWTVNAGGDGLDSNGNLINNGGDTLVYGSANNGNAAIDIGDYGCSWTSAGGSVFAIGMNGMAVVPSSGVYVAYGVSNGGFGGGFSPGGSSSGISIKNGSTIVIRDSSGNIVATATGVKNANCVVYAGPDLVSGQTYTLYVNGKSAGSVKAKGTAVETDSYVRLAGYTTSLNGTIELNFYLEMSEDIAADETAYMQFDLPGSNHTEDTVMLKDARQVTQGDTTYYVFSAGVAAKNMTDDITARFFYNDGESSTDAFVYTIQDYCEYIINHTEDYSEEAQELVKTMLNYGSAAQRYHDSTVSDEELANCNLDDADRTLADVELDASYAPETDGKCTGLTWKGTSIMTTTTTSIRHYFSIDGDLADYTFTADGTELEPVECNGMYYVDIAGIRARLLGTPFLLTVANTKDDTVFTLNYSVYTNIRAVLAGSSQSDITKDLMRSIYWYGEAAKIYLDSNS